MLIAALVLNLLILVPLVSALLMERPGMIEVFGPVTDARLILTSVYLSIGVVSCVLIAAHLARADWAIPATLALFAVQITYKLSTVLLVGVASPVVVTNLAVVAVQCVAIATLLRG